MSTALIYGPAVTPGDLALSIAMGEVGEHEDPPGSNRGPRVDVYLRAAGFDPARASYPWCAAFVTWAVREAQLRLMMLRFRGSASVSTLLARNRGLLIESPERGCVFLHISPKGNHCGFVGNPARDGGILTLEGNSNRAGSNNGGSVIQGARKPGYATHLLRIS